MAVEFDSKSIDYRTASEELDRGLTMVAQVHSLGRGTDSNTDLRCVHYAARTSIIEEQGAITYYVLDFWKGQPITPPAVTNQTLPKNWIVV